VPHISPDLEGYEFQLEGQGLQPYIERSQEPEFPATRPILKLWASAEGYGLELKGTGFSPYIETQSECGALAPNIGFAPSAALSEVEERGAPRLASETPHFSLSLCGGRIEVQNLIRSLRIN
jgi:hypothetical protein